MPSTLSLSVDQLKILVSQCDLEEKIELARFLETETFEERWIRLLNRFRKADLTFEEITQEVEFVRQTRYEQRRNS